jgi:hypothetical protein
MSIMLTETAAKEIRKIIDEQGKDGAFAPAKAKLRVGVKGGGCSGFSYTLDLVEEDKGETDEEREDPVRHEEPALPQRRRDRLQGRGHGPRVRLQEPQRHQHLRLRLFVHGLRNRSLTAETQRTQRRQFDWFIILCALRVSAVNRV